MPLTRAQAYTEAGVNIDAGNSLVSRIKSIVSQTHIHGVLSDIGGFGGLFKPDMSGMAEPVLVASTDGVGTKLKLAFAFDKHDVDSGLAERIEMGHLRDSHTATSSWYGHYITFPYK